jgi:prevent-host-death family protein
MRTVSLAEAKAHLSQLLDSVAAGEEVTITRHGRAVAKVSAPEQPRQPLPLQRLAELRGKVPAWHEPSSKLVRQLREEE